MARRRRRRGRRAERRRWLARVKRCVFLTNPITLRASIPVGM
jgi:hypothetical protein